MRSALFFAISAIAFNCFGAEERQEPRFRMKCIFSEISADGQKQIIARPEMGTVSGLEVSAMCGTRRGTPLTMEAGMTAKIHDIPDESILWKVTISRSEEQDQVIVQGFLADCKLVSTEGEDYVADSMCRNFRKKVTLGAKYSIERPLPDGRKHTVEYVVTRAKEHVAQR
jgi:hypothetical protein